MPPAIRIALAFSGVQVVFGAVVIANLVPNIVHTPDIVQVGVMGCIGLLLILVAALADR